MGRLQTWGAAARRSPVFWAVSTLVVLALVAGGIVLATRSTRSPPRAPALDAAPSPWVTRCPTATGCTTPT